MNFDCILILCAKIKVKCMIKSDKFDRIQDRDNFELFWMNIGSQKATSVIATVN